MARNFISPASGEPTSPALPAAPPPRRRTVPQRKKLPRGKLQQFIHLASRRGFGTALVIAFSIATTAYAVQRGGMYDQLVKQHGDIRNILARAAGFDIDAITINGQRVLVSTEVLKLAGITPQDSLLFLDPVDIRARLEKAPIIQSASVRKLYPNQLIISIKERRGDAVWQIGGEVQVISATGELIDKMRDQRFARLPFVVGAGANLRLSEYFDILKAAGPLRSKIRAGVLVGERRWTIKFKNGLDLKLPERTYARTMAQFAGLAQKHGLLEKDVLSVDMRVPGRLIARLSAEAAARRTSKPAKRKRKGGPA